MQLINEQNWEALGKKFRNADPFPSICIDNFLDHQFVLELSRSYPEFDSAQRLGLEFSTVNEKKKVQITDPSKFPKSVNQLQQEFSSAEFLTAMEEMSGIRDLHFDPEFSGGGMHITNSTGILDVHVDFNFSESLDLYRRLNLLLYLNEKWDDKWGGSVELWDKDVKKCVQSYAPILNRCVIFATSDQSFHGVSTVCSPPNHPRKSFAIYLYNEAPSSTKFGHSHSTIFKARPTERLKKYILMPAEEGWRKASATIRSGKKLIKRVSGL
jgi:Rps23 Pro-64 3,4-dihydroxylase Tpa1-like proline 4-hydroxylase